MSALRTFPLAGESPLPKGAYLFFAMTISFSNPQSPSVTAPLGKGAYTCQSLPLVKGGGLACELGGIASIDRPKGTSNKAPFPKEIPLLGEMSAKRTKGSAASAEEGCREATEGCHE